MGITNSHLFHSRIANSAEHKRVSVVSPALSGRDSSDSHIINGIYTEYDWLLFIVFVLSAFKYKRRKEFSFEKSHKKRQKLYFFLQTFGYVVFLSYICTRFRAVRFDPLAQQVEHNTFNVGVLGSNPKRITHRKDFFLKSFFVFVHFP